MSVENTLVLIKPDGVERKLIGNILSRFEKKGWTISALKMLRFTDELAEKHYAEHVKKPFFNDLKSFITSGPSVAMIISGDSVVKEVRKLMGATKFTDALPGTIRGDHANSITENLVHGSDSPESAKREIGIFFPDF